MESSTADLVLLSWVKGLLWSVAVVFWVRFQYPAVWSAKCSAGRHPMMRLFFVFCFFFIPQGYCQRSFLILRWSSRLKRHKLKSVCATSPFCKHTDRRKAGVFNITRQKKEDSDMFCLRLLDLSCRGSQGPPGAWRPTVCWETAEFRGRSLKNGRKERGKIKAILVVSPAGHLV